MRIFGLAISVIIASLFVGCNKSNTPISGLPEACSHYLGFIDPLSNYRLIVPTAFTPNGDGKNDIARLQGINLTNGVYTVARLNGEVLFESINPFIQGWDGKDQNGNMATDPLYQVRIRFNSGQRNIDTCSYLYLLTNGGTPGGCIHYGTADTSKLVFEDEVDPATGATPFTTAEVLCP